MSEFFENCTHRSSFEHFFENCTNTTEQCELIRYVDTIADISVWMDFSVPLTLFILAIFLNAYFLGILIPEFSKMHNVTRKQYIFIVSRGISSLSASTAIIIIRCFQMYSLDFWSSLTVYFVNDLSFYTLLGSYVGSALLLYFATTRPIFYSTRITVKVIYILAGANWIFSIVLSLLSAFFQAAIASDGGPFDCDKQHCEPVLNIAMFVIVGLSFLIPIAILLFVLVKLCFHKYRAASIGDLSSDTSAVSSARVRLAWTLLTFTLICLSEGIPIILSLWTVGVSDTIFVCDSFYEADQLVFPAVLSSIQTLAWAIALVLEPLCGLIVDPRIRRVWLQHMRAMKTLIIEFLTCSLKNPPKELHSSSTQSSLHL